MPKQRRRSATYRAAMRDAKREFDQWDAAQRARGRARGGLATRRDGTPRRGRKAVPRG